MTRRRDSMGVDWKSGAKSPSVSHKLVPAKRDKTILHETIFWNPTVWIPASQLWHKLPAQFPPTTPTRLRSSSAPVKIDAGALLVLAPLATQPRFWRLLPSVSHLKFNKVSLWYSLWKKLDLPNYGDRSNASSLVIENTPAFPNATVVGS